jgi:hypothetical protein
MTNMLSRTNRFPRQLALLLGSTALVGVLFLVPSGMLTGLPFFLFAPAVLVAGLVSGNVHNISGPVYFVLDAGGVGCRERRLLGRCTHRTMGQGQVGMVFLSKSNQVGVAPAGLAA